MLILVFLFYNGFTKSKWRGISVFDRLIIPTLGLVVWGGGELEMLITRLWGAGLPPVELFVSIVKLDAIAGACGDVPAMQRCAND